MRDQKGHTLRQAGFTPHLKKGAGFTLMELIIVIAVIAILIGIAIPGFFGMLTEAHITQASGDLRTIKTSIESYFMHQNPPSYPTAGAVWESQLSTAIPKILSELLYDPFVSATTEYAYILSTNGLYYVIFSLGPDSTADITGIGDDGALTGIQDDDIFVTNGSGF